MQNKTRLYLGVWLAYSLAALFFVFSCPDVATDVFTRYAPMAEAFAHGNWQEAFHPRFGVGFQTVTGLFVLLSNFTLDGWDACILAATLALLFSLIPLFKIVRRVFDETTAWFCVALLAFSPQVLLWVTRGLRESVRSLGILLLCDALFACRDGRKGRGFWSAAAGSVILCSIRVDAIVAAFFLVFLYCLIDKFSKRSWFLAAVTVLAIQPASYIVWHWTGWWVPAIQYISIIKKIAG